eukprot:2272497-Rhodomonas_salina.2
MPLIGRGPADGRCSEVNLKTLQWRWPESCRSPSEGAAASYHTHAFVDCKQRDHAWDRRTSRSLHRSEAPRYFRQRIPG